MLSAFTLKATGETFWRAQRAAAHFELHISRIHQLIKEGRVRFHKVGRQHFVCVADLEHYQVTKGHGGRKRSGSKSAKPLKRSAVNLPIPQQIERWLTNHPTEAREIGSASELHQRMRRSGLDLPRSAVYRYYAALPAPAPQPPPPPPIPDGLFPVAALAAELEISKKVMEIWHRKGLISGKRYDGVLYVAEASVQAFLRGDMPEGKAG